MKQNKFNSNYIDYTFTNNFENYLKSQRDFGNLLYVYYAY